ncbi:disease resistance protein [Salix suchowensis]|nr:disease resistance protein [Salix suchowensis]
MASSSSSSSSSRSTSSINLPKKHHVFLSFRGEDTRVGFTSHLHAALERKNILTFIDNDLRRGEEISPSLVEAIEDSMLSVIIFSQNYASSKWCLDELLKILESRKVRGQIAIPVFYEWSFGDVFAQLVKRKALKMEEEQCLRAALNEAANISGHDSRKIESESKFIEVIVEDILNKLCKIFPVHPTNLVGIDEHTQDVRIVGIWGMGGIGKTTIARAVYNKICTKFEGFSFMANVREELKRRTKIWETSPFIKDRLRRKKVLIVFDDVDSSMVLQELLLEQRDAFGPGSRILVTSRDQQVLNQEVDATYEVKALNHMDALQLFKTKAFKKTCPTIDHIHLLGRMVTYTKGNPLALVVLGSALCDKSKEDWYSASNGLGQIQNVEILNVLRVSFDGLNTEQRSIFLHIACFFKGINRLHFTRILENKCPSVHYYISVLIDKSLVLASDNILGMHDLLQEMAYSIVHEESEDPGERSRLFDPEDVYKVLKENKGTKRVKGICLDMSKSRKMRLKTDSFAGMNCLEFLIFYNPSYFEVEKNKVHLPHSGLEYLSNELRYFHWDGYPSKSLPQGFSAENLVQFEFSESKVEKLWSGKQNLLNLKGINLSSSRCLTELPDLSKANNLEVPSSFQHLEKLKRLDLTDCHNLITLPRRIDSKCLEQLFITGCSNIRNCPDTYADIGYLDLSGTSVEKVPLSIKLRQISLTGCKNITKFPVISENIRVLLLDRTAIEEVPSSIELLTNLVSLHMFDCKRLSKLPSSICKLKFLENFYLSGCSRLETFPEIKRPMKSLRTLYLGRTAIKKLPSSIRHQKSLIFLELDGASIKELPELPPSLCILSARDCESLETISSSTLSQSIRLNLANCFRFDQNAIMEDMQMKIQSGNIGDMFQILSPGSEIPHWFINRSWGSSVAIQLPSDCHKLKAIAFCLIVHHTVPLNDLLQEDKAINIKWQCHARSNNCEHDDIIFKTECEIYNFQDSKMRDSDHMLLWHENWKEDSFSKYSDKEITFEFYPKAKAKSFDRNTSEMELREIEKHCKVKSCGVYLLFDENPHLFSISDEDFSDQEDDYYSLCSSSSSADEIDHENGDSKSCKTSPATSFFSHRKGYLLLLCFLTFAYLFLSWTSHFCFAPQFIPPPPT